MSRDPVILSSAAPRAIEWAAESIVDGGVIALPTDTVYGLAASHTVPDALDRIYAIKGRPGSKSLPVLVASVDHIGRISDHVDERVELLLDQFWPGPLTVALPARPGLLPQLLAPDGTVGVRMPNHPLALEIIEKAGGVIACTSANRSGEEPAISAAQVAATIGRDLDLTIDGGFAPGGVPSTVISFTGSDLRVVREGAISAENISAAWDELARDERTVF